MRTIQKILFPRKTPAPLFCGGVRRSTRCAEVCLFQHSSYVLITVPEKEKLFEMNILNDSSVEVVFWLARLMS
jgi:hypothetical protein